LTEPFLAGENPQHGVPERIGLDPGGAGDWLLSAEPIQRGFSERHTSTGSQSTPIGEGVAMDRIQGIKDLYAYNRWANHRVLDATSRLSPEAFTKDLGSSFPSVRDTLVHIVSAEWVWLSRWRGNSPSGVPDSWDVSTFEAVRANWAAVERDQEAFISGLTREALGQKLAYRNTRGEAFEQPLWQMLRHVVNHSTYHRGQVVTLLRQVGAEVVSTDLILFYRTRPSADRAWGAD
jgi:uncharacterized damage-inducible protein DinB